MIWSGGVARWGFQNTIRIREAPEQRLFAVTGKIGRAVRLQVAKASRGKVVCDSRHTRA